MTRSPVTSPHLRLPAERRNRAQPSRITPYSSHFGHGRCHGLLGTERNHISHLACTHEFKTGLAALNTQKQSRARVERRPIAAEMCPVVFQRWLQERYDSEKGPTATSSAGSSRSRLAQRRLACRLIFGHFRRDVG